MKKKMLILPALMSIMALFLSGCEPLMIFDPKGPNAKTLSNTIILSIIVMAVILLVVYVLLVTMLMKYRASKSPSDYEPPHEEGSTKLEIIWTVIPILIVTALSIVTISTTSKVESQQTGYDNTKPLVIYAASSNWKWHFSYPEEGVETVNYVNIPTDRPIEFRLYSFGPITSFWIPQLAGQKYAMSDMVNKIHMAADVEGSFFGRNSNFNGKGFAQMEFEAQTMSQQKFDEWVSDVKAKEPELTEKTFNELLDTDFVGRKSFSSTHLKFSPAPEMHHGKSSDMSDDAEEMDGMDMSDGEMDHSNH
ncbi:cytochrome aa3 quinol oxidase subunit II [Viridibacillus arvi]|uniref:cytochrome aa3 quinol oxidase subunit II n=1 Tax=Viridibacillus arvi TaxID=263475 RepID=UPI0036993F1A